MNNNCVRAPRIPAYFPFARSSRWVPAPTWCPIFFSFLSDTQDTYRDYIIRKENGTETRARVCTLEITFPYLRRARKAGGNGQKTCVSASRADNTRAAHVAAVLLITFRGLVTFTPAKFVEPVWVSVLRPGFLFRGKAPKKFSFM